MTNVPATLAPATRTLLAVLDNQVSRTDAAFEALTPELLHVEPGGDCHSILEIGRHLVFLRRFQLHLLESPLEERVTDPDAIETLEMLTQALHDATELLREAISTHDVDQWFHTPSAPRPVKWGDEPPIVRIVRPLNDYANHLGAIRVVRRINGNPAPRTQ